MAPSAIHPQLPSILGYNPSSTAIRPRPQTTLSCNPSLDAIRLWLQSILGCHPSSAAIQIRILLMVTLFQLTTFSKTTDHGF
jgi:hypothetical protein